MKKAKIALAAIAAFSVIGVSLAFKANSSFSGKSYFTTTALGVPASNLYNVNSAIGSTGVSYFWTTISGNNATQHTKLQVVE